ncbi:hypothetical protein MAP_3722 [Mycobacterium avium subsp. paratuberculosis K-10]|uniref:Uncharacterized protein n=1 Tax=Mycolicibacterium paratuberculosis (strain ATCC BAA-968 / K-10) TaxID=262316 RepID=Q73TJ6_MYCPA|nr:hypothetical protein MAP_3722 [Mycobacterium avium subsp. paratuberculosis K-10]
MLPLGDRRAAAGARGHRRVARRADPQAAGRRARARMALGDAPADRRRRGGEPGHHALPHRWRRAVRGPGRRGSGTRRPDPLARRGRSAALASPARGRAPNRARRARCRPRRRCRGPDAPAGPRRHRVRRPATREAARAAGRARRPHCPADGDDLRQRRRLGRARNRLGRHQQRAARRVGGPPRPAGGAGGPRRLGQHRHARQRARPKRHARQRGHERRRHAGVRGDHHGPARDPRRHQAGAGSPSRRARRAVGAAAPRPADPEAGVSAVAQRGHRRRGDRGVVQSRRARPGRQPAGRHGRRLLRHEVGVPGRDRRDDAPHQRGPGVAVGAGPRPGLHLGPRLRIGPPQFERGSATSAFQDAERLLAGRHNGLAHGLPRVRR